MDLDGFCFDPRTALRLALSLTICCFDCFAHGQAQSTGATKPDQLRVVVASPDKSSENVIAIPPDTSWTGSINFRASSAVTHLDSTKYSKWLQDQRTLNGLQSGQMPPWHIVIEFDLFDKDRDNVHSGLVEEFWAGPNKYKISYNSDTFNQTDYATDHGLFRQGDQRWPNRAETQVLAEIVDPFHYAATLQGFSTSLIDRTFGSHTLQCAVLKRDGVVSVPTQYCFDPTGSVLRYSRGEGWYQTTYNEIESVGGHTAARDVEVTDGGQPFLKLRVKTLELISQVKESEFTPPENATNLTGKPVTGVVVNPIKTGFPEWPDSLRAQQVKVTVEILIGRDGHVVSAHAVSGPPNAYKSAEATAKKWIFQPFLVLGEAVEVNSRIELANN